VRRIDRGLMSRFIEMSKQDPEKKFARIFMYTATLLISSIGYMILHYRSSMTLIELGVIEFVAGREFEALCPFSRR
jgi:hypothetical protein